MPFTSPFEKGGLRGILIFQQLKSPLPPFFKGGNPQMAVTTGGLTHFSKKEHYH